MFEWLLRHLYLQAMSRRVLKLQRYYLSFNYPRFRRNGTILVQSPEMCYRLQQLSLLNLMSNYGMCLELLLFQFPMQKMRIVLH